MNTNNIDAIIQKNLNKIQSKMKAIVHFPNPTRGGYVSKSTGFLKQSIKLECKNGQIIFYTPGLVRYAKYQDEGTYGRRNSTIESRKAWGTQQYKRGRSGTGIHPQNFTDPLKELTSKNLVTIIKPIILQEMTKQIKSLIKKI